MQKVLNNGMTVEVELSEEGQFNIANKNFPCYYLYQNVAGFENWLVVWDMQGRGGACLYANGDFIPFCTQHADGTWNRNYETDFIGAPQNYDDKSPLAPVPLPFDIEEELPY